MIAALFFCLAAAADSPSIHFFRVLPGVGLSLDSDAAGADTSRARSVTGYSRRLAYRATIDETIETAASRARAWAVDGGDALRLLYEEADGAEWLREGDPHVHRIVRLGRVLFEVRGPAEEAKEACDRFREIVREAPSEARAYLLRPRRSAFLEAEILGGGARLAEPGRIAVRPYGRTPREVHLTEVLLRYPAGAAPAPGAAPATGVRRLEEGEFRVYVLDDRLEVLLPRAAWRDLDRARVSIEGSSDDGVPLRTLRPGAWERGVSE